MATAIIMKNWGKIKTKLERILIIGSATVPARSEIRSALTKWIGAKIEKKTNPAKREAVFLFLKIFDALKKIGIFNFNIPYLKNKKNKGNVKFPSCAIFQAFSFISESSM